jgi:hypothetical protein
MRTTLPEVAARDAAIAPGTGGGRGSFPVEAVIVTSVSGQTLS